MHREPPRRLNLTSSMQRALPLCAPPTTMEAFAHWLYSSNDSRREAIYALELIIDEQAQVCACAWCAHLPMAARADMMRLL